VASNRRALALATLALALIVAPASPATTTTVQYATGTQGQPLLLDAYPAASPGRTVVVIHGGQWTGGGRAEQRPVQTCTALQARGVTCFSIDYELAPAAQWPAQLANMRAALEWAQEHAADYNGSTTDISFWGQSSGGHLALLLAFDTPGVRSVVAWSAPTDLTLTSWGQGHARKLLGCKAVQCPALAQSASPVHAAHAGAPPILLAHSLGDRSVPYAQSQALAERLSVLGVPHRLDTYSGTKHAGQLFAQAFGSSYGWWAAS
jgi:acetyl esterase/lipase